MTFTKEEISQIREVFKNFDSRGDDRIPFDQIGDVLRALGTNPTKFEIKKFTKDLQPDERVTLEVFLPILQAILNVKREDRDTEDIVRALFQFDKDGSGLIHSAELRRILSTLGERMDDEEIERLFVQAAIKENPQGYVNYEDLARVITAEEY